MSWVEVSDVSCSLPTQSALRGRLRPAYPQHVLGPYARRIHACQARRIEKRQRGYDGHDRHYVSWQAA